MPNYKNCVKRIAEVAGRELTDDEVLGIFKRVHKAALDINAGRAEVEDVGLGKPRNLKELRKDIVGSEGAVDSLVQKAAERAARELEHEAMERKRMANLQLLSLATKQKDRNGLRVAGIEPLLSAELLVRRDYTGKVNIQSLEQLATGYRDMFKSELIPILDALGTDYLGFFQDKEKVLDLLRQLRGEDTGNPVTKKAAEAWFALAEKMRVIWNSYGGDVGKLDDWGKPQHHSQQRVSSAASADDPNMNRQKWIDDVLPMLDRSRYVDDFDTPLDDDALRQFLSYAWDSIATDGIAHKKPGVSAIGARATRHNEHRQIHFKDAESEIRYWEMYGEKTLAEILIDHVETLSKDIAMVQMFGPNPNITWQTVLDEALQEATIANPRKTEKFKGKAQDIQEIFDYASGRTKPDYNPNLRWFADTLAHLTVAGKGGAFAIASFFGDKPMLEAVSHLNNLPEIKRWQAELSALDPTNVADRRLLQQQGLMLDGIRSALQRFYEGLGKTSFSGKLANAVLRITGMNLVNDARKGSFGIMLMSAIGRELKKDFTSLADSDIRALRHFGVTEADWKVWQLAQLQDVDLRYTKVEGVLTKDSISRITDDALKEAGIIGKDESPEIAEATRTNAIVKLLGAVNTEAEFAIVTPGWQERSAFYGDMQRGRIKSEIVRSVLQFKSFPFAYFHRSMDAIANSEGPVGRAAMVSWLLVSGALVGAMIVQTKEILAGRDPLSMLDENKYKFWMKALVQGGGLGIYGDFFYGATQTRYGSGILEAVSGPTLGPLLELGLVQPLNAAEKHIEGKESFLAAQTIGDLKGFVPGNNMWFAKAATEHLIWQRIMESLSPGYLASMRKRAARDYNQESWWEPGEISPDRLPRLGEAIEQ